MSEAKVLLAFAARGHANTTGRILAHEIAEAHETATKELTRALYALKMARREPGWFITAISWIRREQVTRRLGVAKAWHEGLMSIARITQFAARAEQELHGTVHLQHSAMTVTFSLTEIAEAVAKAVDACLTEAVRPNASVNELQVARLAVSDAARGLFAVYHNLHHKTWIDNLEANMNEVDLAEDGGRRRKGSFRQESVSSESVSAFSQPTTKEHVMNRGRDPAGQSGDSSDVESLNAFVYAHIRLCQCTMHTIDGHIEEMHRPAVSAGARAIHVLRSMRKMIFHPHPFSRFRPAWVSFSVQMALAISVASLFTLVTPLRDEFGSFSTSVLVTVVLVSGDTLAGSLKQSFLRWQGTAAGAVYGYIIYRHAVNEPWVLGTMLLPWVTLCALVRLIDTYAYAGSVAAFTAAIVMLTRNPAGSNPGLLSFARIELTVYGIVIFVFISTVVLPRHVRRDAHESLLAAVRIGESVVRYAVHTLVLLTASKRASAPRGRAENVPTEAEDLQSDMTQARERSSSAKFKAGEILDQVIHGLDAVLQEFEPCLNELPHLLSEAGAEPRFGRGVFHLSAHMHVLRQLQDIRLFATSILHSIVWVEQRGQRSMSSTAYMTSLLTSRTDTDSTDIPPTPVSPAEAEASPRPHKGRRGSETVNKLPDRIMTGSTEMPLTPVSPVEGGVSPRPRTGRRGSEIVNKLPDRIVMNSIGATLSMAATSLVEERLEPIQDSTQDASFKGVAKPSATGVDERDEFSALGRFMPVSESLKLLVETVPRLLVLIHNAMVHTGAALMTSTSGQPGRQTLGPRRAAVVRRLSALASSMTRKKRPSATAWSTAADGLPASTGLVGDAAPDADDGVDAPTMSQPTLPFSTLAVHEAQRQLDDLSTTVSAALETFYDAIHEYIETRQRCTATQSDSSQPGTGVRPRPPRTLDVLALYTTAFSVQGLGVAVVALARSAHLLYQVQPVALEDDLTMKSRRRTGKNIVMDAGEDDAAILDRIRSACTSVSIV